MCKMHEGIYNVNKFVLHFLIANRKNTFYVTDTRQIPCKI